MRYGCMAVVIGLAVAAAGAVGQAQGAEDAERAAPRAIGWVPSLESARKQAAKREAPILVAVHRSYDASREPANHEAQERMMATYRDPAVVKACRPFVCVIVSLGWQGDAGGDPEARRFGRLTARHNAALEKALRETYFGSEPDVVAPQHLVLGSDGRLIDRYLLARTPQEFVRLLKHALDRFQGKTPVDAVTTEAREVVRSLKVGDGAQQEQAFRQALAILGADPSHALVRDAAEQYLRSMKGAEFTRRALPAIDQAGTEGAILLLVPFLKHGHENVRRRSLEVIAGADPCKSMLPPLAQCVRTELEENPLRALVSALDAYADEFPEALAQLNQLVSHKSEGTRVLATFAAARPENKAIYGKLLARARSEKRVPVRVASILGLALMEARSALPALQSLREGAPRETEIVNALDTAITVLGGEITVRSERQLEREVQKVRRAAGASEEDDRRSGGKRGRGKRKGKGRR